MLYKYIADNYVMNDSLDFARKSGKSNDPMYERRGQSDPLKTMLDRYYGKIAEWAVYYHLISLDLNPTKPDMVIYEINKKSYDPDIYLTDKVFHVKTCKKEENPSWVFQKNNDPLVFSPKEDDIIVLTTYDSVFPVSIEVLKYINAVDAVDYYDDLYNVDLTEKGKTSLYWFGRVTKKNNAVNELDDARLQ